MEKLTISKASLRIGSVILGTFPFSNLSGKKVRPALVLAQVEFGNLILCQITSNPYSSKSAIQIEASDFIEGRLPVVSYVRPDKLFTADLSIVKSVTGELTPKKRRLILQRIRKLFTLT
jgi:mRNA interferase MazF